MSFVRNRIVLLPLVLCLPACGSNHQDDPVAPPVAAFASSGSRLRARVFDAGSDSRVLSGLHDSMLGFDCAIGTTSDGALRCVPSDAVETQTLFSDPECRQPAILGAPCQDAPAYVTISAAPSQGVDPACATRTAFVYEVKGAVAAYYSSAGGGCAKVTDSKVADAIPSKVYALGAIVSPSRLVKVASKASESLGSSLSVDVAVFEDGARMTTQALHDKARDGAACTLGYESSDRCWPLATPRSTAEALFSDSACSQPALLVSAPSVCDQRVATAIVETIVDPSGCQQSNYFSFGAPVHTAYYSYGGSSTCSELPSDGASTYITQGDPIPEESIPQVTTKLVGNGAVQIELRVTSDGAVVDGGRPVLAATGQACEVRSLPNGTRLCIASTATAQKVYGDPLCTTPVVAQPKPPEPDASTSCYAPPSAQATEGHGGTRYVLEDTVLSCASAWKVRPLAKDPAVPSSLFAKSQDGTCSQRPIDDSFDYFQAGDPIDAGAVFPVVNLGVD